MPPAKAGTDLHLTPARPRAATRAGQERAAITLAFFVSGVLFTSLFARLPTRQADLGLTEGQIALVLLALTLGLAITQPLTGALVARTGSRPALLAGGIALAVVIEPFALAPTLPTLIAAGFIFGAANGAFDVGLNAQGIAWERRHGRDVFATFHAAFAFGSLSGALTAAAAAGLGATPPIHLAVVALLAAAMLLIVRSGLPPADADADRDTAAFARPSRRLVALAAIAFLALMASGVANDWSTIHLATTLGASDAVAATALAAFWLTFGAVQLITDRLAARVGAARLVRSGAVIAVIAFAATALAPTPAAAIAALLVFGAGVAPVFPLALQAAARRSSGAAAPALAAVSTAGYLGLFAGPALVGGLAEITDLRHALLTVAVAVGLITMFARALAGPAVRHPRPGTHGVGDDR